MGTFNHYGRGWIPLLMDELHEYRHPLGFTFFYRPNTTDYGIILESCGGLYTEYFDIGPGEVWLDIGGCIGSFAVYAHSKGAIVQTYEPFPENYHILHKNLIRNQCYTVEENQLAVTADGRDIELYINRQNFGACSCSDKLLTEEHITCKSVKVSDIIPPGPICVKIDTEGCEWEILTQLPIERVKRLVFEHHYWLTDTPARETKLINILLKENFEHVEMHDEYMYFAWTD